MDYVKATLGIILVMALVFLWTWGCIDIGKRVALEAATKAEIIECFGKRYSVTLIQEQGWVDVEQSLKE